MDIFIDKVYYTDWEFIRWLRNLTKDNFIHQHEITKQEHQDFMMKNYQNYYVALINPADWTPIGFVGDVGGDIRFAVHPDYQGKKVGTKLLQFIKEKYPFSIGKVKKDNISSNKAFEKAKFVLYYETENFNYWVPDINDDRIWPDPKDLE